MYERINNWRRWKMPHESVSKYIESVSKIWKKRQERSINAVVVSISVLFSSVAQSCLTLCDPMDYSTSLTARLPYPSPTPRACSNSCPSSQWYRPTISLSVIHFSSCLQSFRASRSFSMSQFFTSGGHSIGASALVLPKNIQDWFPLGWTGWISLLSKGLSRVTPTRQVKSMNSSALSFLYSSTLTSIHDHWKNHSLD